jgi:hypothetical protein
MIEKHAWSGVGRIRWLSAADGGLTSGPPRGSTYFATVALPGAGVDALKSVIGLEQFSVHMEWDGPSGHDGTVRFRFLSPEMVESMVYVGRDLVVMAGPQPIAMLRVVSLT